MASERKLTVVLAGDAKGLQGALRDGGAAAEGFGNKVGGLGTKAKVALAGAGIAALGFVKDSVQAYAQAEESQKRLSDAFERFPALADVNKRSLQELDSQLQKHTKYDDDVIASGQAVVAQFGLTGKQVQSITPLLLDYASRTGKDIPAAAMDVGKALLGNAKALKNIGIKYTATGDTAKDFANIQDLLAKKVGGFAEKEGTTAAGKLAILKNQFGELEEKVGSKLIPVLTRLADVGLGILDWFDRLSPAGKTALAVLAGLAGSIFLVVEAVKAWTAVQTALNVVMSMNPIGLVVIAIAGLVAGLVLAYNKVGWFRDLVNAAFNGIATVVGAVVGFIKDHWQLLLEILTGPVGIAVGLITSHWQTIRDGFTAVKDWIGDRISDIAGFLTGLPGRVTGAISGLWQGMKDGITGAKNWVHDRIEDVVGFVTGLPGRISRGVSNLFDGFKSAFKSALNWIIDKWNSLHFTLPSISAFGHKIGGQSFGVPQIPKFAAGGIVQSRLGGILAQLGEGGSNEAVTPLTAAGLRPWVDAILTGLRGAQATAVGNAGTTVVVNVTVQGSVTAENSLVDSIRRSVEQTLRRNGPPSTAIGF